MKKILSFFNEWVAIPAINLVIAIIVIWLIGLFITFNLDWAYPFLEKISHGVPFGVSVRLFVVIFYFLFTFVKCLEKNEKK